MPRTAQGRIKINVFVDERVYDKFKLLATRQRQPVSELLRASMELYLVSQSEAIEAKARQLDATLEKIPE